MPLSPITPFYNQSVLHHLLYVVFRTFSPKEFCRNLASFLDEYMPVSMLEIKKYDNFIISKIASYSANSEIFDSPDRIEIPEQIIQDICQDPYLTQCKSSAKIIRSTPDNPVGSLFSLIFRENFSCIYYPLLFTDHLPASIYISIVTAGTDRYTQEHLQFLDSIRLPLVAALGISLRNISPEYSFPMAFSSGFPDGKPSISPRPDSQENSSPHLLTLNEMIRAHILNALKITHGRVSGPKGAAMLLGIPASTLASQLRRLGIKGVHKKKPS